MNALPIENVQLKSIHILQNNQYSIEVQHLTKAFGPKKAINNISFNIKKGEVIGFLGPNGAGKSTTMRILAGLIPATSGIARINGISIALHPQKIKRNMAFMPENNPLPEDLRVIEYLRHRAGLKEIPKREQKKQIETVMDLCDLTHTASQKMIRTLSKGFRQRIGIADALLANPKVLILDEPTIGLDPHQILAIRHLIKNLQSQMTILISSHILPEIEVSCDQIIILNQGVIVAQGSSEALKKNFSPESIYKISAIANNSILQKIILNLDPSSTIIQENEKEGIITLYFTTLLPPSFSEVLVEKIQQQSGWKLREIVRNEPTLEDIFLVATKPSWKTSIYKFKPENTLRIAS